MLIKPMAAPVIKPAMRIKPMAAPVIKPAEPHNWRVGAAERRDVFREMAGMPLRSETKLASRLAGAFAMARRSDAAGGTHALSEQFTLVAKSSTIVANPAMLRREDSAGSFRLSDQPFRKSANGVGSGTASKIRRPSPAAGVVRRLRVEVANLKDPVVQPAEDPTAMARSHAKLEVECICNVMYGTDHREHQAESHSATQAQHNAQKGPTPLAGGVQRPAARGRGLAD